MQLEVLAALAEPNRLRIVELLAVRPRPVGEVAAELDLRQPQATKHLQALERAGLVTVHPLGQRRIYSLRRVPLRDLRAELAAFEVDDPDEDALTRYRRAIGEESGRLAEGDGERTLTFSRQVAAPIAAVWRAWTTEDAVRQWWRPAHFTVHECTVDPHFGGVLRIVIGEGDGSRYVAEGTFLSLRRPTVLRFDLAPLGPDGDPMFAATHELRLSRSGKGTRLSLTIRVANVPPAAAPAVAGLEQGWEQLLDALTAVVTTDG